MADDDTGARTGSDANSDIQHAASGSAEKEGKKSPVKRIILILVLVAALAAAAIYWFLTRFDVETDDAFTTGRTIAIAPHVNGYVTELLVNDNQYVHKGQVLLRIDNRDYNAALQKAQAAYAQAQTSFEGYKYLYEVAQKNFPGQLMVAQGQLASAQAQEFRAKTDYNRQHSVARAATTQQDIDYSKAALDSAEAALTEAKGRLLIAEPVQANVENTGSRVQEQSAQIKQAQAELTQAELNSGWTEIRAPQDGWISQRNVEKGTYVSTGQTLFSIVTPEVWIVANYKETQVKNMRPGQKVDIRIDAYPFLKLKGHVDSLQFGTGSTFSAFPPENATGNYVKIVQRLPVKILIDEGLDPKVPLALGLSVEPTVYTK